MSRKVWRTIRLQEVHAAVADALEELQAGFFKPEMMLTFIARMPGNPECEMVVTCDDLAEVAKVIERRQRHP